MTLQFLQCKIGNAKHSQTCGGKFDFLVLGIAGKPCPHHVRFRWLRLAS